MQCLCELSLFCVHCRNLQKTKSKIPKPSNRDWPTVAVFRGSHNHALSSAAVHKYRDLGIDSKQRLCELFRQGHSASSALHCLKTDLLIKHGGKHYEFAAGHFVTSLSVACKLLSKEFHGEYGSTSGPEMFSTLENMLTEEYNENMGCKTKFGQIGNNYYVVMCTPLMTRVHKLLQQTSELVMVDAAGAWTSSDIDCICSCHQQLQEVSQSRL